MRTIHNHINGVDVPPAAGRYFDKINPATGEPCARVPDSDESDVCAAIEAARAAFPAWSKTPAAERSRLLMAIADRIAAESESLACLETEDTGKPLRLCRAMDIPRSSANLRFFATAILHTRSETYRTDSAALNYTLRFPRGVAGLISPWNLPLYLFTWKIAPALATGNTAVGKPSELTPSTAHRLGQLAAEAGLPPGVLNIVHGTGPKVGGPLVAHPSVPSISFTGGTVTGANIAATAGPLFKRVALELGGKNPTVICADADFEQAIPAAVKSAFENQGEICLCGSRIYVEEQVYGRFVEEFVGHTRALRVGDPVDPGTDQGALVSSQHRDKVAGYVEIARQEGGTILCGGTPPHDLPSRCRGGYFFTPTVITNLPSDCRVNREEIFGPVVTISPFRDERQLVDQANGVSFGLAASLWTRDLGRAHRLAELIEAGTVWVNCWLLRDLRVPFGGVKQSGVGREGGDEALRFFTEVKAVCIKT